MDCQARHPQGQEEAGRRSADVIGNTHSSPNKQVGLACITDYQYSHHLRIGCGGVFSAVGCGNIQTQKLRAREERQDENQDGRYIEGR